MEGAVVRVRGRGRVRVRGRGRVRVWVWVRVRAERPAEFRKELRRDTGLGSLT